MADKGIKQKNNKSQIKTSKLELLITIVDAKKSDYYEDLIQSFEVNMQMVCSAEGTATEDMRRLLGLTNSEKVAIFSFIKATRVKDVLETLEEKFKTIKNGKGIAYTIPLTSIIGVAIFTFLSNNVQAIRG